MELGHIAAYAIQSLGRICRLEVRGLECLTKKKAQLM